MLSSLLRPICFALAVAPFGAGAVPVTGSTGGGQPFDNMQPSLVLNEVMTQSGIFPSSDPNDLVPFPALGGLRQFATTFPPYQTPLAQGQSIGIASNTELFSLLGTNYGGNGTTTFALPDLTGRVAVHAGTGPVALGGQFGIGNQTLGVAQLPAHAHSLSGPPGVTGMTGGGQPFDNRQPSLGLNYIVAVKPPAPNQDTFLGQVGLAAGPFAPGGFLFAEGQVLQKSQYPELFNLIGNKYGGDGVTTFALPDLRGRTAIGAGQGPGLTNYALGATGGASAQTLTVAQMPAHTHTVPAAPDTGPTGGGQPFDNRQPYLALHYMIALEGIFPSMNGNGSLPLETIIGEILMYLGDTAPAGFAFAEGQLMNIAQNTALFSLIENTYGGDVTSNTFALPDLRGRAVLGSGGEFDLGEIFGDEFRTLTLDQLPPHVHSLEPGVTPVPAPGGAALLLVGLAGLAGSLRRRPVARP